MKSLIFLDIFAWNAVRYIVRINFQWIFTFIFWNEKNGLVTWVQYALTHVRSWLISYPSPMSVRQCPRRTQLLKRHVGKQNLPHWESRVTRKKCYRGAHMRATLLRRTLSEDAWGVREKCAPNNSREKNGAWSETGKRAGEEKVTRVSERTKGYLTRAMTATIVSNASKQCRRRVPGTESRSFWRGPSFRLAPVCERAFPFLGISIICGPAADSRQIYPRFATENEQCLFLVFFPVLFYHCGSRNSVTYTRGREIKRRRERKKKTDPQTRLHMEPASRKYPSIKMMLSPFETKQTCRSSHEISLDGL